MSSTSPMSQKEIIIIHTPEEFQQLRKSLSTEATPEKLISIAMVPTMGALHEGHFTLLQKARQENDIVVLTIFVNPTQFNDPVDFKRYPKTWDTDLALAKKAGVDYLFVPTFEAIYPDNYLYKIIETELSRDFCGKDRPGHFDGVLTIVMKLLNIVKPHKSYFGEKDFQQLCLVQGMVKAFFIDCEIVSVPTVREVDGLALSSRNRLLSEQERNIAPQFYKALSDSSLPETAHVIKRLEEQGIIVDYIKDFKNRRLGAIRFGQIRLIDNIVKKEE